MLIVKITLIICILMVFIERKCWILIFQVGHIFVGHPEYQKYLFQKLPEERL